MFCPNCGAQNQDTATACAKCGFTLKAAAAAPKFKGTMLMMNAPPAAVPRPGGAPPPGAGAPPPGAAPPPAGAQPPAPAAAAPAAARPKLKGTMIGVAPPSMGSHVSPQGGGGAQPPAPAAAPPTHQQYAPPPPAYEPPPPAPVQHAAPQSAVNPLGGTVVADTSAFVAGPPTAQGGFPNADAPPPPQNFPGGQTQGFAAPPPQYGAPPQPQAYGNPPPGFGAPPQNFGAPPQNFGGPPPGYGAPPQNFGAPPDVLGATAPAVDGAQMYGSHSSSMAPVQDSLGPIPGVVGGTNPIVTVLLIVLTCGVYGIYLLVKGKKSAS